jgi:enoyl-CoA hydratase/3-hydroxyacyl-CoA dehydrogenase
MGAGIAFCMLAHGHRDWRVVLKDVSEKVLAEAQTYLAQQFQKARCPEAMRRLVFIQHDDAPLAQCDVVVEAVPENLNLKRRVLKQVAAACPPHCVVATNTSSIELSEICQGLGFESRFIGLHFFNPPAVMPLVEVVYTPQTDPNVIAQTVKFVRSIRKTPVVVKSCVGFAANRIFFPYSSCARFLVGQQGLAPYQLDQALRQFGFPLGPFALADLVGLDVGNDVARIAAAAYPRVQVEDPSGLTEELVKRKRLGRTTGAGWYTYAPGSRKPQADPEIDGVFKAREAQLSYEEGAEMMLFLVANEGARLMEEGIVEREGDVDVCTVLGFGFPPFLGGVMYWARHVVGWKKVVASLNGWKNKYNDLPLFQVSAYAVEQASK